MEILTSFIIASTVLAFSPGPDNIFVLTQSIVKGKKYGLATVFGLVTGCLVHTTLVAFGVSAIIKDSENLFFGIKLFGALYLLYLAFSVFKSDASILLSNKNVKKKSVFEFYKQGFIMNVLNPKVSIFFLAFFPAFLFSKTMNTVVQFYILGFVFMIVTLIVFGMIAVLAASISEKIQSNKNIGMYLKWTQIIVFITIAGFIIA